MSIAVETQHEAMLLKKRYGSEWKALVATLTKVHRLEHDIANLIHLTEELLLLQEYKNGNHRALTSVRKAGEANTFIPSDKVL